MPNTNNPGVTNAGVFTLDAAGGLPAAGFALDAEAVASGGAFLASELEKRDMTIRKPLTSVTYPRDIPIKTGGGWVDYASAMAVAYGITGARSAYISSMLGTVIQMVGGAVGLVMLAILVVIGALHLITPVNMFLYQLIWLVHGWLITEWTRAI